VSKSKEISRNFNSSNDIANRSKKQTLMSEDNSNQLTFISSIKNVRLPDKLILLSYLYFLNKQDCFTTNSEREIRNQLKTYFKTNTA